MKVGAIGDNMDPSLVHLLERYANDLKAVPVKSEELSTRRDTFAALIEQTADATRAWQKASAAKDTSGVAAAQSRLDALVAEQAGALQRLRAECAK